MKNILITGGAGFLGSHLCARLLREGNRVSVLDNLSTGNESNLREFHENKNFSFKKGSVVEEKDFKEKFDEIYNLACQASPIKYQKDPIDTMKTSVLGSLNLLEYSLKNNSKILQASTSEIYGDPLQTPQKENYFGNVNSFGPRSCYDEGKRAAESLFYDFHSTYNLEIKVSRIFNTYGPNMSSNDGRVISNFICQALKNEDLTVYGDGNQTRSFCYVDDLINGLITLMNSSKDIYFPINLGNPNELKIIEIAKMIIKLTNSSSKIAYKNLPNDDPKIRCPDISRASEYLGWKPNISLRKGLLKTIKYFKEANSFG